MKYLSYKNKYQEHKLNLDELFIEEVSLAEIAKTIPTPIAKITAPTNRRKIPRVATTPSAEAAAAIAKPFSVEFS